MKKLKLLLKILLLIPLLYCVIFLVQCTAYFHVGDVSKSAEEKIIKNINKTKTDMNLTGELKIHEIYRTGVPSKLTEAKYTYSEVIDNQKIALDGVFTFENDGSVYTDRAGEQPALSNQIKAHFSEISLKQATYKDYKFDTLHKIKSELIPKNSDTLTLIQTELAPYGFYFDEETSLWLEKKAKENRQSSQPEKQPFYGYYNIPPTEMMAHLNYNLTYAVINPNHQEPPTYEEIDVGRDAVEKRLATINIEMLPPGKYHLSFGIVSDLEEAIAMTTDSSITSHSYGSFMLEGNKLVFLLED